MKKFCCPTEIPYRAHTYTSAGIKESSLLTINRLLISPTNKNAIPIPISISPCQACQIETKNVRVLRIAATRIHQRKSSIHRSNLRSVVSPLTSKNKNPITKRSRYIIAKLNPI